MKKLSGWQKVGFGVGIGCFAFVVMLVLGVITAVFWARATLAQFGDATPTQVARTIALPVPVPAEAGGDTPAVGRKGNDPLQLEIDLEEGDFDIRPGPPGGQVQVDGRYAESLYELTETKETATAGRSQRTKIRFRSKAPAWARMLGGMGRGGGESTRPRITVLIPEGVPIDLSLRVSMGESHIDLGGLTLSDLGLDLSMGNHAVDFKKPVVEGLRRVRVTARMGNVTVENLGNAHAKTFDTSGSMGNVKADLGGAWQPGTDTELSFTHSMGELTLNVPTSVRLEADVRTAQGETENRPAAVNETADPKAPLLRVRVSTSMGESHVVRY